MDVSKIKLVAFDLDGTLTQHKTPLSDEHRAVLDKLGEKYKLVMLGAGMCRRIFNQMGQYPIDIYGNYGMQMALYRPELKDIEIVENVTMPCDKESVDKRVTMLREKYGYTEYAGGHLEFHASGMVTFCLLGSGARIEDKVVFDPDRSKRRVLYDEICSLFPEHVVYIGGSSSFDFAPKRYNKYDSIMKYAREHGYSQITIGVEAIETRNLGIYLHWDYNRFVMSEGEGEELTLYYAKNIKKQ
jgi:hypothetical protein